MFKFDSDAPSHGMSFSLTKSVNVQIINKKSFYITVYFYFVKYLQYCRFGLVQVVLCMSMRLIWKKKHAWLSQVKSFYLI